MKTTTLQAEVRGERGKGPARRLRAQGKIPGVFYGPGLEPTPLTLSPKTLEKALRSELRRNAVLKLQLGEIEELAMVRDLATDPVTQEILHVDLYRIFEDRELELKVPFRTTGRSIGVVQGGVLNITRHYLPVRTKPANIPAVIEIDVTELDLKQSVAVKDLKLPAGVVCLLSPELTLASVLEDRRGQEEEELKAAEAAAAAAAAGAVEGAVPVPGAEAEAAPSEGDDKKDKKDKKKDED